MQLNHARFRAADSARFTHSHGPLTSRIINRNLSKHVKATCGFVNIARKAEIAQRKDFFFFLKYKSFPIQTGFEQLASQKHPTCGVPPRKPPTENEKFFFSISTTRLAKSVEGLNSSLAQSPGEL